VPNYPQEGPRPHRQPTEEDRNPPEWVDGDYPEVETDDAEPPTGDEPINEGAADEPVEVAPPEVLEEEKEKHGVVKP
jgi:hypothetical protein